MILLALCSHHPLTASCLRCVLAHSSEETLCTLGEFTVGVTAQMLRHFKMDDRSFSELVKIFCFQHTEWIY